MSTKSKTGAKLVASIRKSKTGTVASKTSERPDATETASKSGPSSGSSGSKAATSKQTSKGATSQHLKNSFSSGRRVWPD